MHVHQQKRKSSSNLTKENGAKARKLRGNYKVPNFSKNLGTRSNIYDRLIHILSLVMQLRISFNINHIIIDMYM